MLTVPPEITILGVSPEVVNVSVLLTGFRALYFHYCYLLGVFPKGKQQNRKRLHFLLKEDLIKLDAITQEAVLNTQLYQKMFSEQAHFKNWLMSQPPEEVLKRKFPPFLW